jgi:hypothetical protein
MNVIALLKPLGVSGRDLAPQLMVEDKSTHRLGYKKTVAKLHLRTGFPLNDHMNVVFVKAEDLVGIGHWLEWPP